MSKATTTTTTTHHNHHRHQTYDRGVIKVGAKLFGVQRGGRDDDLQVGAEEGNVLDQAKQNVGVQGPLVRLVDHHARVRRQVGLVQKLAQQHSVRHVLRVVSVGKGKRGGEVGGR